VSPADRVRRGVGFFLYVDGSLPVLSATLASVYAEHKGPDLLLHMVFETQSTFGHR
jgi:hypothetical protein